MSNPIDEKIFDPLKSSNSLKNFADCLNGANKNPGFFNL